MGWGNNDGSADVDGGAVGGTAGNVSGPGPGEAEGTGFGGMIGGYSGYDGGAGIGPHGTQAAGPTMGMMDQAADMNVAALSGGLVDSAGGMEFGGMGVPGSQGNVPGGQHAGSAGDSFSNAVAALDAAIGSMPNLEPGGITYGMEQATAPPSTGLPGMGYGGITNENFDPMGSAHMGQFGQGSGVPAYGGTGQTMGTGIGGVMSGIASPGVGYGTGALGEMGAAPPTGIGNPMGYGMDAMSSAGLMGPGGVGAGAPGGPGQNQAAGIGGAADSNVGAQGQIGNALDSSAEYGGMQAIGPGTVGTGAPGGPNQNAAAGQMDATEAAENFDPMGSAHAGQFGQQNVGPSAPDSTETGATSIGPASQAEADALDGWSGGVQATGDEQEMEDVDQDLSGMPTGMTAEQTNMIVAGLKDAEKGKGFAYALNEIARAYLGLPKSTPESRMKDALSNYDAQGKQDQMEMDVSTGEDDKIRRANLQAVSDFRKKYKWAKDMSAKEIQAYIDNPALLNLKIGNEKMKGKVNGTSAGPGTTVTANDIRQLWAPAMFS